MGIHTEHVRFGDAGHSGFMAWPDRARLPLPAVVVVQEAWGLDDHIEDIAGRIARAGYVALAPDLYAHDGVRPPALTRERLRLLVGFCNTLPPAGWSDVAVREAHLQTMPESDRAPIAESMAAILREITQGNNDDILTAATDHLRNHHPATRGQKIAAMGFCLGGGRAARLAALDPALAGAAIFYGTAPPDALIPQIACPVVGFYGALDERYVGPVPAFAAAMEAHGKHFTPWVYPGAYHAFFNDGRPTYHVAAARDAWARLLTFLLEQLG